MIYAFFHEREENWPRYGHLAETEPVHIVLAGKALCGHGLPDTDLSFWSTDLYMKPHMSLCESCKEQRRLLRTPLKDMVFSAYYKNGDRRAMAAHLVNQVGRFLCQPHLDSINESVWKLEKHGGEWAICQQCKQVLANGTKDRFRKADREALIRLKKWGGKLPTNAEI